MSIVIGGLVGWLGGILAAALVMREYPRSSFFEFVHFPTVIAPVVLAATGVLVGLLAAFLLVSRTHGSPRCPRCGTPNAPHEFRCSGCDLALNPAG